MHKFATIGISLFLLTCSACSTAPTPQPLTATQVVKVTPPGPLLQLCNLHRQPKLATNGDVEDDWLAWRLDARNCAARQAAVVDWFKSSTTAQ